jgi:hypothetical protein
MGDGPSVIVVGVERPGDFGELSTTSVGVTDKEETSLVCDIVGDKNV